MYYYNQRFATDKENAILHTLRSDIDYSILTHLVDTLGTPLLDDESKSMLGPFLQCSQQLLEVYKNENLLSLQPGRIQQFLFERQQQGKSLAEAVMREEELVIYEAITRRCDYYVFLRMYKFDVERIKNEYNVQQRKLRAEQRRIDNQKWLEETYDERRSEILGNIKALAENYKGKVSHALYRRKYPYSGSAVEIKELFGDWNQALSESGVKEIMDRFEALASAKEEDPEIVNLKERIIEQIRECHMDNGKVSASIYELSGRSPSIEVIKRVFGKWTDAMIAAGLPTNKTTHRKAERKNKVHTSLHSEIHELKRSLELINQERLALREEFSNRDLKLVLEKESTQARLVELEQLLKNPK
ncbi:hypothetical protein [Brevibacillus reuszeri]|uniref:hypothetical protein n=1 Tax=Brevibacillus reuszeri TaxID=54915 RepID=UPI000CCC6BA9|nr:hypothetical protein [Brevibacillus reuszeri]